MLDFHNPLTPTVHVVNRSTKLITGTWDGKQIDIPPGYKAVQAPNPDGRFKKPVLLYERVMDDRGMPLSRAMQLPVAKHIIKQHPVMGTQEYGSPQPSSFLLGVIEAEENFPTTHQDQSGAKELFDVKTLPLASRQDREEIPGDGRIPIEDRRINTADADALDGLAANV